jgi:hypothetical protein
METTIPGAAAIAGSAGNIVKQNRMFPPPARTQEMSKEEKAQGG